MDGLMVSVMGIRSSKDLEILERNILLHKNPAKSKLLLFIFLIVISNTVAL
jgi:hypothetical protein